MLNELAEISFHQLLVGDKIVNSFVWKHVWRQVVDALLAFGRSG